jgi:hypothetical protein
MNSNAFWSDFGEKQNGNLVWLRRGDKSDIMTNNSMTYIPTCTRAHTHTHTILTRDEKKHNVIKLKYGVPVYLPDIVHYKNM